MVYGQNLELPISAIDPRHVYQHKYRKLLQDMGEPVTGREVELKFFGSEQRQCNLWHGLTYVLYMGTISSSQGLYKIGCTQSPGLTRRKFLIEELGAKQTFIWADKSIVFESRPIDLAAEMKSSHYLKMAGDRYYYSTDLETAFLSELPASFKPSADRLKDLLDLKTADAVIKHAGLSEMFIWDCEAVGEIARMRKTRNHQISSIIEAIRFSQHKQRPHRGRIRLAG